MASRKKIIGIIAAIVIPVAVVVGVLSTTTDLFRGAFTETFPPNEQVELTNPIVLHQYNTDQDPSTNNPFGTITITKSSFHLSNGNEKGTIYKDTLTKDVENLNNEPADGSTFKSYPITPNGGLAFTLETDTDCVRTNNRGDDWDANPIMRNLSGKLEIRERDTNSVVYRLPIRHRCDDRKQLVDLYDNHNDLTRFTSDESPDQDSTSDVTLRWDGHFCTTYHDPSSSEGIDEVTSESGGNISYQNRLECPPGRYTAEIEFAGASKTFDFNLSNNVCRIWDDRDEIQPTLDLMNDIIQEYMENSDWNPESTKINRLESKINTLFDQSNYEQQFNQIFDPNRFVQTMNELSSTLESIQRTNNYCIEENYSFPFAEEPEPREYTLDLITEHNNIEITQGENATVRINTSGTYVSDELYTLSRTVTDVTNTTIDVSTPVEPTDETLRVGGPTELTLIDAEASEALNSGTYTATINAEVTVGDNIATDTEEINITISAAAPPEEPEADEPSIEIDTDDGPIALNEGETLSLPAKIRGMNLPDTIEAPEPSITSCTLSGNDPIIDPEDDELNFNYGAVTQNVENVDVKLNIYEDNDNLYDEIHTESLTAEPETTSTYTWSDSEIPDGTYLAEVEITDQDSDEDCSDDWWLVVDRRSDGVMGELNLTRDRDSFQQGEQDLEVTLDFNVESDRTVVNLYRVGESEIETTVYICIEDNECPSKPAGSFSFDWDGSTRFNYVEPGRYYLRG